MTAHPMPYAMVGGGEGSFIGAVHRRAIALDGRATLVSGSFSSTAERSRASGVALGLDPSRVHASWDALIEDEAPRAVGDRARFVVIVTPNHLHHPIARAALESGLNVVCDKPFTVTSQQADELCTIARRKGLVCAVTYNYTGYPMVRQAAAMVQRGDLGDIRKVFAEYHQGWLASPIERDGQKQASWRTDPARAGVGGAVGDIGTHAYHLATFVTGLRVRELAADLTSVVPGRSLDDDAAVFMRFDTGARGVLTCSQVCTGEANGLTLRVYGDRAGLRWRQEAPDELVITSLNGEARTLVRGSDELDTAARDATRLPPGHPEGFHDALANLYAGVFDTLTGLDTTRARLTPGAKAGLDGVRFVEACVASDNAGSSWVSLPG